MTTLRQRMREDIVELTQKVGFDIMPVGPTFPKGATGPEEIEPNVWKFTNPSTGVWSVMKYSPDDDMYSEVDSSIKEKGLSEFEKYVEGIEDAKPEWDESMFESMRIILDEYGDEYFIAPFYQVVIPYRLSDPIGDVGTDFCELGHLPYSPIILTNTRFRRRPSNSP